MSSARAVSKRSLNLMVIALALLAPACRREPTTRSVDSVVNQAALPATTATALPPRCIAAARGEWPRTVPTDRGGLAALIEQDTGTRAALDAWQHSLGLQAVEAVDCGPTLALWIPAVSCAPPEALTESLREVATVLDTDCFAPQTSGEPADSSDASREPLALTDRTLNVSTTRGRIACGEASCDPATQRCIALGTWHCVAANDPVTGADEFSCDDASDCETGKVCCSSFSSASTQTLCAARTGSDSSCRQELCAAPDGAPCPKGQVCADGVCQSSQVRATCDKGARCPPDKPVCLWADGKGTCSSHADARESAHDLAHAALYCAKSSDCGTGLQCCTNALWDGTQCLANCDAANNGQLCTSDRDCSNRSSASGPTRCLPNDGDDSTRALPSWIRWCRVAE
ncbi:MAG TPA: hypothetical protein VHM70_16450 [Polyangiaceae bacterium]|jgi:hypothetical protein|nr:hypothetical protein [Polyangiaceae bacterium]